MQDSEHSHGGPAIRNEGKKVIMKKNHCLTVYMNLTWILRNNWQGSTLKEWINATKIPPHERGQSAAKDNLILLLFRFGDPFFFFFSSLNWDKFQVQFPAWWRRKKLIKSTGGYKNH